MTDEEIIKEVILSFREKCRLGEPIGRWEKEMEFTVKLTLALQKKDILEKIDKLISEKGQSWDSANGLGPDVVSVDDLEDIKEYLT